MPIVKSNQPLGERPVIIFIYGEPGIGKTSLFNTADTPLLLDFDRGVDRSINRPDTLIVHTWEDVLQEEEQNSFAGYKTVGIDTAKAALDDFLMNYVIRKEPKNRTNKLQMYGAIGDEFKQFIAKRRAAQADIVILAHAKEEKEGDVVHKYPDVTGGSYQLCLRIADQVGYMKTVNNKRFIQFDPSDSMVGKNVARFPLTEIPNESDPKYPTFLADLIRRVKASINSMSEEQAKAVQVAEEYHKNIDDVQTPEGLTNILASTGSLPDYLKIPLRKHIKDKAAEKGFISVPGKGFELAPPAPPADPAAGSAAVTDEKVAATQAAVATDITSFDIDDRSKKLSAAGVALGADGFEINKVFYTYEQLATIPEVVFEEMIKPPAPATKPKGGSKKKATA